MTWIVYLNTLVAEIASNDWHDLLIAEVADEGDLLNPKRIKILRSRHGKDRTKASAAFN